MKISARNLIAGSVSKITKGAVNSEITLTVTGGENKGGEKLVAIITNGSVETLGLKEGKAAYAIIKASSVIVGKDLHGAKISTRNILCGTVSKLQEGAVNTEVGVSLAGGLVLTAVITNPSTHALGLKVGEHACLAFKASSVIVGVD